MNHVFTIDKFEGPLDLLLHLIKQSNINIHNIEIDEITKQYLNYINQMTELNLDIASSYLVMAAELIEMKAAMLLPRPEVLDNEYEEDPKERLIKRLIEYQSYKEITPKLQHLELDRKNYFTKEPSELVDYDYSSNLPEDLGINDLVQAFENFLSRKEFEKPLVTKIATKEYSVEDRALEIKNIIKTKKNINFFELFTSKSKDYIVVTFLSVLVLVKNNEIAIKQENNFDDILLCEV